jgi:competence ComEA-like helix-hairpin-helix protein
MSLLINATVYVRWTVRQGFLLCSDSCAEAGEPYLDWLAKPRTPKGDKLSTLKRDMFICQHSFVTFPQKLWKSLWKSRPVKLQVPENFILLAFCTRSRQNFRISHEGRFGLPGQRLLTAHARSLCFLLLACVMLISSSSCVKSPRRTFQAGGQISPLVVQTQAPNTTLININLASPEELEKLPGIGRGLAARIIAHRKEYGRFRRAEHLMMVRGISERRFHAVRASITAE